MIDSRLLIIAYALVLLKHNFMSRLEGGVEDGRKLETMV